MYNRPPLILDDQSSHEVMTSPGSLPRGPLIQKLRKIAPSCILGTLRALRFSKIYPFRKPYPKYFRFNVSSGDVVPKRPGLNYTLSSKSLGCHIYQFSIFFKPEIYHYSIPLLSSRPVMIDFFPCFLQNCIEFSVFYQVDS